MVKPADVLGLTRGYKLEPLDEEVVEYYLLRRLLGQELPLEGMILEDDPLSAPPWELLKKHQREDDAFFFAHGQTIDGKGSRNKRTCAGGGCWEGQKVVVDDKELLIVPDSGMEITWKKYQLNFHNDGEKGSTGWVMREYSVTSPPDLASSSVRLYRILFSGYGKKRKREPDDHGDDDGGERAATRQAIPEERMPASHSHSSLFPQDQDRYGGAAIDGNQWPPVTSSDQNYVRVNATTEDQHLLGSSQDLGRSWFLPGGDLGVGPAGVGVMHEFTGGDGGVAPVVGTLPSCGAMDDSLDIELPENINFDEFFAFDEVCGLEGHLDGQFSGAGMHTQLSGMQPRPNPYYMSC